MFEGKRRENLQKMSTDRQAKLAHRVGQLLRARRKPWQTVAVVEATSGGLVGAALQAVPGASRFYLGSAGIYSGPAAQAILPPEVIGASGMMDRANYSGAAVYVESKRRFSREVSRGMRKRFGASWCVAESGTCGPEFYIPGVEGGFTAVGVAGPDGFSRVQVLHTGHGDRLRNMSAFGEAALELLVRCIEETQPAGAVSAAKL
jgi:nicotinamide-nucleotide amidase